MFLLLIYHITNHAVYLPFTPLHAERL